MPKIFYVLLFFMGHLSFSQLEQANYAGAASEFMALYNVSDYDGIFNMFDVVMKEYLPREQARNFFSKNVNAPMGAITEMRFKSIDQGAHIYSTNFEKAVAEVIISLNTKNQINGLAIRPPKSPKPLDIPILDRNTTSMILPFEDEWFVFWGGTNVNQNYHVSEVSQQYAYDILQVVDGASYDGDSKRNESYHAFGKAIIAPCDARVALVIKGVKDNIPGQMNPADLTGNTVVLKTEAGEFILFAHLMEGSILVQEGQDVTQGEVLGKCGNSGNSTEPHLHLSLQNDRDMSKSTGAKLYFDQILVNGELKNNYLPLKEDSVKNIE